MLARIWWKEWRLFGPAMGILLVAAAGFQWVLLATGGEDVKTGDLTKVAICWAMIYAFAAGSAAFASERESKTLAFLDALPVPRSTLWLGKATFAIASTFALAAAMVLLAASGTEKRMEGPNSYGEILPNFASVLVEAVAWGLFWSSMLRNSMAAAAASLICVAVLYLPGADLASRNFIGRWIGASAALVASGLILAWRPRLPVRVQRVAVVRPPAEPRVLGASVGRSLIWQTYREGRANWALMMVVGLLVPIGDWWTGTLTQGIVETFLAMVACLMAGVAAFGTDNASGTRRFLHHQGIAPGQAWGRRMGVWGLGIAVFVAVLLVIETHPHFHFVQNDGALIFSRSPFTVSAMALDAFGVGAICGMAFRRRILAGLVSVVGMVTLVPLQVGLAEFGMIPSWSLYASPLILLGASRVWAGDWLAESEGWRPWSRLGLTIAVPFSMLIATYCGYRAWSVPYAPPLFSPSIGVVIERNQPASEVYRRALAEMVAVPRPKMGEPTSRPISDAIERGWEPEDGYLTAHLEKNRSAIGLARQAAAVPRVWFGSPDEITYESAIDGISKELRSLALLLALEARERQSTGNLAGAWDDILAQFRMARQLGDDSPTYIRLLTAGQVHHQAVGLAEEWACDPKQTLEAIRKARGELMLIPEMPTIVEAIKVESGIIDRTLDRPTDDLDRLFLQGDRPADRVSTAWRVAFRNLVVPAWERERARRITRRLFADEVAADAIEPFARPKQPDNVLTSEPVRGCPLARMLYPYSQGVAQAIDREHAGRRMLDQVLALRSWQLVHDGKYPDSLQALVPSELALLPVDPFSGRPFGYILGHGQYVRPPAINDQRAETDLRRTTRPGQRLLYSVGPDGVDDHAESIFSFYARSRTGDFIIALP